MYISLEALSKNTMTKMLNIGGPWTLMSNSPTELVKTSTIFPNSKCVMVCSFWDMASLISLLDTFHMGPVSHL